VKLREAAHVVDVRMRADDGAQLQIMPAQNFQDAVHFITGIHYDCLFCGGIAEDRAVALQHADRDDFVDQFFRHRRLIIAALFGYIVEVAIWRDLSSRAKSRAFCFPLVFRARDAVRGICSAFAASLTRFPR